MDREGWEVKRLGDVCLIERGGSPRPINQYITKNVDGINWIKIGDTEPNSKYIKKTKEKIIPEGMKKSRYVQKGDFLLSNSMSFGRPYILNIDGCIHDGWLVIRDNNNIFNKDFLYYFLVSPTTYLKFKLLAVGGVVNNLNSTMVRNLDVLIPPLPIQNKIVKELDTLSDILTKKKAQLAELDTLAQAIFYDMFGDPVENEKGWVVKKIKEFSTIKIGPFGSALHVEDYIENGIPLVNPSHMYDGKIIYNSKMTISKDKSEELAPYLLKENDIIIGRRGEIGRCAVVTSKEEGFICGTGSLFIRFIDNINPIYFYFIFTSDSLIKILLNEAKGATMLNINSKIISNIDIPLPPLPLQNQFAQKIEAIEQQKALINQSITEVQLLFDSTMDKYFN